MSSERPPRSRLPVLAVVGVALLVPTSGLGHPPVEEALAALTRAIEQGPSVTLLCRRGELEVRAGRPARGRADFERAVALDPTRPEPWLCRAQLALDTGDVAGALEAARTAAARCTDCAEARFAEARALDAGGEGRAALAQFDAALAALDRPHPEQWLERAELAERGAGVTEALRGLDVAVERMGDLLPLHLAALDLEVRLHRTDDALRRLDRLEGIAPNHAEILARRADVLFDAGRSLEAWSEYTRALEEVERLSPDRRALPGMRALEVRLRARLREAR